MRFEIIDTNPALMIIYPPKDHQILTENGYVAAQNVKVGDLVTAYGKQFSIHAAQLRPTDQLYEIKGYLE
jgi:hypothetical protein